MRGFFVMDCLAEATRPFDKLRSKRSFDARAERRRPQGHITGGNRVVVNRAGRANSPGVYAPLGAAST